MLAATGPEPVGETKEVSLVYGVQHLDRRTLDDLVLQRGDTERTLAPVRLWYEHPARRLRPVCAPVDSCVQILKVALQVPPVLLPRHAVHPRCSLGLQRPVGRPQAIDIDVMQERGEPRFPVLLCCLAHAIQPT